MQLEFTSAMSAPFGLAIVLLVVGNVLLGAAVWRSGTLPRWAGAAWVASALMFYVLSAVLGMATTGASLPTQPVGGLLMVVGGGGWPGRPSPAERSITQPEEDTPP